MTNKVEKCLSLRRNLSGGKKKSQNGRGKEGKKITTSEREESRAGKAWERDREYVCK